ncbi:transcription termination factor NusA [Gordonia rubripertincta]|uniref:Transcription termination/antitermination protein NusA n=2 Tax=Gordonia rubripertincta TaxID=36822 RepID=A0AAW4G9E4_GORRU|nr:transcription termination factor NusA [Gordonia rubripertincta]MBM7279823.1 transcription termination/antitermination protein NusA [Gordonia rubripertincta]MDG6779886.1 transcription termination factor NusA [Gordonia rubripertincta]NKY63873.1 transcription termination/antitermination protein NusA [Gordonia rubripertincta]TSD98763.1 transcription termination/antitermination protein NusA [Gordonia rubripertincta]GAB86160.1 transcription elongation protein NusA [Gordonia rubripertincta NBRC 10
MNIDIGALRMIEADKGISIETVITAIETALLTAYRHTDGFAPHARVDINRKSGAVRVMAQELDQNGDVVHEWDDTPEGFGRIAATTARQVILQRLRDAENEKNFGDLVAHEGEIVGGVVQQDSRANARGMVVVQIGSDANSTEGVIPPAEQVPGEVYTHGDRIKCYVVGVSRGPRGPQITLSRTHPNLVRKLFSLEVPEIEDGSVEIVAVAREAGHRSKIAVHTGVAGLNAKGACIGPMGQRVRNVMSELAGEKIDIIDFDSDPGVFVGNALSPAKVVSVTVVDAAAKAARVVVPDYQLSLAIGKEGQNARLAARLTGWRIDIRSDAAPAVEGSAE